MPYYDYNISILILAMYLFIEVIYKDKFCACLSFLLAMTFLHYYIIGQIIAS